MEDEFHEPNSKQIVNRPSVQKISIVDLEVFYRVGVPDAERAQPQKLLLTIEMEFDFAKAANRIRLPTRLIILPFRSGS